LVGFSQVNESFEKANQLYNSGDYEKAASEYESILLANQHSAGLYYNLANCYYRLNDIASSIFYYEKALLLDPDNKEITTNLGFAQKNDNRLHSRSPRKRPFRIICSDNK